MNKAECQATAFAALHARRSGKRIAENAKSGADALFLDLEEPRTPCPESVRVRARGLVREFLDRRTDRPRAIRCTSCGSNRSRRG